MGEVVPFTKNPKQPEACDLMNRNQHALMYGGSRSGKTFIAVRNMILRGLKKSSCHLIVRKHFNDVKRAIFHKTFPDVMKACFPGVEYKWNKQDWFVTIYGPDGIASQIWLGGISDEKRAEKILGNEYSTIFANECSQIPYESIILLRSRLAETAGHKLRFYYDLNPSGKKHWTYQEFVLGLVPGTKKKSKLQTGYILINPIDNLDNLDPDYLDLLDTFPDRLRARFLKGLYLSEIEGALWTDQMITDAQCVQATEPIKTVIAVDPAVTNTENSDETGIIPCSIDEFGTGIIHDDLSGKFSTGTWAQRAVNAYHLYDANCIVAEVNQGGDLVEDAIHNIDPTIKVIKVRASKGKFARAEPVSQLYEDRQLRVRHEKQMPELEEQLTEWVPLNSKKSPDRLDALVWGLTYLMLRKHERTVRAMVA